jgi:WhiB family redox-sensing transcriptional regulator
MGESQTWQHRARCRPRHPEGSYDPELWFPVGFTGPAVEQAEAARAVCRTCPVRTECLDEALTHDYSGVWGGTTEAERRAIRSLSLRVGAQEGVFDV